MLDSPPWEVEFWIGLHRDPSNSSRWHWTDGTLAALPDNWKGKEDCVKKQAHKWNDLECSTYLHYSCEVSLGRSRYVRTTRNEIVLYSKRQGHPTSVFGKYLFGRRLEI